MTGTIGALGYAGWALTDRFWTRRQTRLRLGALKGAKTLFGHGIRVLTPFRLSFRARDYWKAAHRELPVAELFEEKVARPPRQRLAAAYEAAVLS
jgi:hypothetical protein